MTIATKYAQEWGHVVVLKGAFTVVAAPNREATVIPVASPALARAGTGDVLAGLIVGLMAQGHHPDHDLPVASDSDTRDRLRAMVASILMSPSFLWR